jgi:PleD family two-component response regulator
VGEGLDLPVTISGGVAVLEDGDTCDSFVDRADQALYGAKQSGRNQLLMWQQGQLRPVVSA